MELQLGSVLIWDLLGRSNQLNQKPISWAPGNSDGIEWDIMGPISYQ